MEKSVFLSVASLFSFFLSGCSPNAGKVLYEGSYNGVKYQVKSHQTRTYNGSRTDWRIQMGNLRELPINITLRFGTPVSLKGVVTTDWGPPYSDDIFGDYERVYFGAPPAYSSAGDDYSDEVKPQHDQTMLYMNEHVERDEYRQYAAFMKAEWAKIDKALAADPNSNFPHIIGLVHGSRQLFTRVFRGTCNGIPHVLRINPDGYVNFGLDDEAAERNNVRHCKVRMPGKVIPLRKIYLWEDYKTSKAEIAKFKDAQGKGPKHYFKLEE